MKTYISKILFVLLLFSAPFAGLRAEVTVWRDKIEYGVRGDTAYVYDAEQTLTSATILSKIVYNNKTYPVTSIGEHAFENCDSLRSVTIPGSVTSIGGRAFMYCRSLRSVTIPGSVTSIGGQAFENCYSLTSVTIPGSVTSIGRRAFLDCSNLSSVEIQDGVTEIGGGAFCGCSSLRSVTIPGSVTSIGSSAFEDCSGLSSVEIQNGVTSIGGRAFMYCCSLRSVTIPGSVTSIGNFAFQYCRSLRSVTIPGSVTDFGRGAFEDCSGLSSVEIQNGVTDIGWDAFWGCSSLTSVTIPGSVTSIGGEAFEGCTSLREAHFASIGSLCSIDFGNDSSNPMCNGAKLYIDDEEITDLAIPSSVTHISDYAFYGCCGLTSVTIPSSVMSIGNDAFGDCSGVKSLTLACSYGREVREWSNRFVNLVELVVENGVTSLGANAFNGCKKLRKISLPASLKSIDAQAFSGCNNIRTISLPAGLKSIGCNAFAGCTFVDTVIAKMPAIDSVEVGNPLFSDYTRNNATLYVPIGVSEAYSSTDAFYFKNIVERDLTEVNDTASLSVNDITLLKPGNKGTLRLNLFNRQDIVAAQFDLVLPKGVSVQTDSDGDPIAATTSRTSQHSVRINKVSDGHYAVVLFSTRNKPIVADTGAIATIPIVVEGSMAVGDYTCDLKNIVLSYMLNGKAHEIYAKDTNAKINVDYLTGDANGDGKVSVADVVEIVNYIVKIPSVAFVERAADYNRNGTVNVADLADVVECIVSGASTKAAIQKLVRTARMAARTAVGAETLWADNSVPIEPGKEASVNMYLRNTSTDLTAYQFDLELPDGIELATDDEGEYAAWLNGERHTGSHTLTIGKHADGGNTYTFLCYSTSNRHIKGNDGVLLTFKLRDTNGAVGSPAALTGYLRNIIFSTANTGAASEEHNLPDASFTINEYPVGINGVTIDGDASEGALYTIDGVKLPAGTRPSRGIYISNGKKILVK